MAPKRAGSSSTIPNNTLTPQPQAFPRSPSPSSSGIGIGQLFSRPAKWFGRSASNPRFNSGASEPRASTSSTRKHKISKPTDPRPILETYQNGNKLGSSHSVLDLSSRTQASLDIRDYAVPASPSSPHQRGLGDLRSISSRPWSKSADDLRNAPVSPIGASPTSPTFQAKVTQYRSRSHSNASLYPPKDLVPRQPPPPVPPINATPPPSSSPPSQVHFPSPTISVSAPGTEEDINTLQSHVHVRSHSFTPKLPSKLAAPRFPISPKRKGSGGEVDREGTSPTAYSPVSRGSVFPFGLGGHGSTKPLAAEFATSPPSPRNHGPSTLLAPPTIHEQQDTTKRSSQIVHYSSFVNRLADGSSGKSNQQLNLSSTKAWRPFKMELKGTKLHLYKPPSDRSAAIKDLFPMTLIPDDTVNDIDDSLPTALGGDDELSLSQAQTTGGREDTTGRRRRAYWGRGTHPGLVRDQEGVIEGGTFESLVHEIVFSTTFPSHDIEKQVGASEIASQKWMHFTSAVLLCVPPIVGQRRFESEFRRCCDNLISGCEDKEKAKFRERVARLAGQFLLFHQHPSAQREWNTWKEELLPGSFSANLVPFASSLPASSSTQAFVQASPAQPSLAPSPNVNMFSPRPEDSVTTSLSAAVSPMRVSPGSAGSSLTSRPHLERSPWSQAGGISGSWLTTLQNEGFSRDVMFQIGHAAIARSLTAFHRKALLNAPIASLSNYLLGSAEPEEAKKLAHFFGSPETPHWLTKLVLVQVLGSESSTKFRYPSSPGASKGGEEASPPPRTYSRSENVTLWVKVAECCRVAGDECSWQAILSALTAAPIARLEKVWRRVELGSLAAVESWVYSGSPNSVLGEPKVTPWAGDTNRVIHDLLGKTRESEQGTALNLSSMEAIRERYEHLRTSILLCPTRENEEITQDISVLVSHWHDVADGHANVGISGKFQRVEQFMSLSFAAEPKRKGLFEPYFWARQGSTNFGPSSLLPLLVPEALPTITLVDRSAILRTRVDSTETHLLALKAVDGHLLPDESRRRRSGGEDTLSGIAQISRGGTVIPVCNGEVLVVVQSQVEPGSRASSRPSSRVPSRPPSSILDSPGLDKERGPLSRTPSIIVKPGSTQSLERKSSMARRNSLPVLSSRRNHIMSEPSSEPPLRVIVRSGTLDQLVNILTHGLAKTSVSVSDDNGETTLREGMTRELTLDRTEFADVWWNVYRSFVTPLVLFELLRKLYVTAQPPSSNALVSDYLESLRSRSNVLDTIKEWICIGAGAQDFLDDTQLYSTVHAFLEVGSSDHEIPMAAKAFEDPAVHKVWTDLQNLRMVVWRIFNSYTSRPPLQDASVPPPSVLPLPSEARIRHLTSKNPPDLDVHSAEEIVDNLDGMACAVFSNVTEEDLLITSDLLEVQSTDRIGWYPVREFVLVEDAVEIQTIYSILQDIEPSSMINDLGQDSFYRLLPPSIRGCVRAFSIVRKWLTHKLVAPQLGAKIRQARVEVLLGALEVTRIRSGEHFSVDEENNLVEQPCVRSFVEAVITSALLSPESRMHQRLWNQVAANRSTTCDSLASIMFCSGRPSSPSPGALTVDMGWFLERLLDVISTPDVVTHSEDTPSMINLDKRRHMYSLISKAPPLLASRRYTQLPEITGRGFERLNVLEREASPITFDLRSIRDDAQREGGQQLSSSTAARSKQPRPFPKLVAAQVEKNRRDKSQRTRLVKEKLSEQSRHERRDDQLSRAMRPHQRPGQKHRSKKSMSSAFMQFMRPISSAFTSDPAIPSSPRTASELDFVCAGKPTTVLSLMEAKVTQVINNERSFVFRIDTEDGGHYVLQAINRKEMGKWLETIVKVSNMAAKRRLTYLGPPISQPLVSDHLHRTIGKRDPNAVFAVDLAFLLRREAGGGMVPPGTVPAVLEYCLSEVERRGLTENGIYRQAGSVAETAALREAFNSGEWPVTSTTDIYAVCDLVKMWFRVLPDPVFTPVAYYGVIEATELEELDDRLLAVRNIIHDLPQANFDVLKRISEHLAKVTDFEEHNQMTEDNLAIVFSPNILRAPQHDLSTIVTNMGKTHKLVKAFITHYHFLFDEKADGDDEDSDSGSEPESALMEVTEEDEDEDEEVGGEEPPSLTS